MMYKQKIAALIINSESQFGESDPKTFLESFLTEYVWMLLGVAAFLAILYSGFLFVTSMGDSEKVKKARKTLLYSVVGILVVVLAAMALGFFATEVSNIFAPGTRTP